MKHTNVLAKFLAIIITAGLMQACHLLEKVEPSKQEAKYCLLTKIEYEGGESYSFSYDAKNRLIGAELITRYPDGLHIKIFTTESDSNDRAVKLIKREFDSQNILINENITYFVYDNKGLPIYYHNGNNNSYRYYLEHDQGERLIKIINPPGFNMEYTSSEYNDIGNCVANYHKLTGESVVKTVDFTSYDNHKNPFYGLGIISQFMGFPPYSKNNIRQYSYFENAILSANATYSYTYDDNGNVLTASFLYTPVNPSEETGTYTGKYFYDCK